jgi:hypothetical protein
MSDKNVDFKRNSVFFDQAGFNLHVSTTVTGKGNPYNVFSDMLDQ